MQQGTKSRTFAILTMNQSSSISIEVVFLYKKTVAGTPELVVRKRHIEFQGSLAGCEKDWFGMIVKLLVDAGLTVRTYDSEEKKWMDESIQYGVVPVQGARDGSWGVPNLQEFDEHYLGAL